MQTTKTYLYIEFENGVIVSQRTGPGSLLTGSPGVTPEPTPAPVISAPPPEPTPTAAPIPEPDFLGEVLAIRSGNEIRKNLAGAGVIEVAGGKLFPRLKAGSVDAPVGFVLPGGYGWKQAGDKAWYIEAGAPDLIGPNKTAPKNETLMPVQHFAQRPIPKTP